MRHVFKLWLCMIVVGWIAGGLQADDCPKRSEGDINNDCRVDMQDLLILAAHWLDTNCVLPDCRADLVPGGGVNMADLASMSEHWNAVGVPLEINEVLSHSHLNAPDWVEIYNPTDADVDISGWYLSDSNKSDPCLMKYEIQDNTIVPAGGYVVFDEHQHFGRKSNPGCRVPFSFNEAGDQVYLSSAVNGVLTGYTEKEDFGGAETGITFGRYYNSGSGKYNFIAMAEQTRGGPNDGAKIGPVVISEIMYHAADAQPGEPSSDDDDYDYLELQNITDQPVDLFREYLGHHAGWRFTGGAIGQVFPDGTSVGITIPANGFLLLVKNAAAFRARYTDVPAGVQIVQWGSGKLSNKGERIELSKPGDFEDKLGGFYFIRVERINYDDKAPWPESADGDGDALIRKTDADGVPLYSNNWHSWFAGPPSPGRVNPQP